MKKQIKITRMGGIYRICVFKGSPLRSPPKKLPDWIYQKGEERSEAERLSQSLSRTKSTVRGLVLCNEWEYFVTLTLRQDRYDLRKFKKDFGVWVGNFNKKYGCKLRYLVIPEQHKDGATHAHGVISGVPPEAVTQNEYGYMTLPYYEQRFGFISMSRIRKLDRAASYITKYITKSIHGDLGKGEQMFFSSQGLNRPEEVFSGQVEDDALPQLQFENEYVGLRETPRLGEQLLTAIEQAEGWSKND